MLMSRWVTVRCDVRLPNMAYSMADLGTAASRGGGKTEGHAPRVRNAKATKSPIPRKWTLYNHVVQCYITARARRSPGMATRSANERRSRITLVCIFALHAHIASVAVQPLHRVSPPC